MAPRMPELESLAVIPEGAEARVSSGLNGTAEAVPSRYQCRGQRRISKSYRCAGPTFGCDSDRCGVVDLLSTEEASVDASCPSRPVRSVPSGRLRLLLLLL